MAHRATVPVTHRSPNGEEVADLPVRATRFASQPEAEAAGIQQGRD